MALLSGFGMNPPLVFDPLLAPSIISESGAKPATLHELLAVADFMALWREASSEAAACRRQL